MICRAASRLSTTLSTTALLLSALIAVAPQSASAQAYPNKPITVIVPYGPGTGIDLAGRIIGQKLSEDYGQPLVIKNMSGASGNIGADAIASSTPDGYTIGLIPNSGFINQFATKNGRDPLKDFVPVAPMGTQAYLLAVPLSFAPKTLKEIVAYAKAHPGQLNYTALPASVPHFLGVALIEATGIDIRMVSYKNTTEAINDVLPGRVQLWFTPLPSGLPFVTSGKVRGIAITNEKRSTLIPDVPTMRESGFPTMGMDSVLYMVAPRGTPPAIVNKLNADVLRITAIKDISDKLLAQGLVADRLNAAELLESMRAEQTKWANIVKASGIKPE